MNHMKEVAHMLGVELGEKFKVKGFDDDKFMLTSNGMFYYDEEDDKWQESLLIYDILKGTRKIVKSILDEKEKEYLSYVIKPFKDRIKYVYKYSRVDGYYEEIAAKMIDCGLLILPPFDKNTMYKGMELNKDYSLEELGL